MNKKKEKIIANVVIVAFIVCGICWIASSFIHIGGEYTNNAQIRQDIVAVTAHVQGVVKETRFEEFQYVQRGDTLVIIEDSEYRLRLAQAKVDYQNALAGKTAMATDLAKAVLDLAEQNLSYTVVLAPCNGIMSRKDIQVCELISPGKSLFSVVDNSRKWIVANYRETQRKNIHIGDKVEISVDAFPNVVFEGKVEAIANATGSQFSADNSVGNFVKVEQRIPVKIVFTRNNDLNLLEQLGTGMNVECKILN